MSYCVLIVDDEPLTRKFLSNVIPQLCPGFPQVCDAKNGVEALELLRSRPFDLLITDIRMPQMDGLALAGAARELCPQLLIVILSGYDDFTYAQQAIRHGVSDYLLKPIDKERLRLVLETAQQRLDERRSQTHDSCRLRQMAEEYQTSIAAEYLEALHEANASRRMAVSPLVKQMQLPLFEGEQQILSFALDYASLLSHTHCAADLDTWDFVLYQTLRELAREWAMGRVYYFGGDGYRVLLSGGRERAEAFCRALREILRSGMNVDAACGCSGPVVVREELAMHARRADLALLRHLSQGPGLYAYEDPPAKQAENLARMRREVYDAARTNDDARLQCALEAYAQTAQGQGILPDAYATWLFYPRPATLSGMLGSELSYVQAMDALLAALRRQEGLGTAQNAALEAVLRLKNARMPQQEGAPSKPEDTPAHKARRFILEHYQNPISLIDIAEYAGMSPNYLSTLFSRQWGESYIKYLTRIRMEAAARLLRAEPETKVAAIAERCGFFNGKHFYHVFRQTYGVSPGEYQNRADAVK